VKNDKKILESMKELSYWAAYYVDFVTGANTCAHTDRVIESVVEKAEEIKKLHEENFNKGVK
jgi:hypothetical protein